MSDKDRQSNVAREVTGNKEMGAQITHILDAIVSSSLARHQQVVRLAEDVEHSLGTDFRRMRSDLAQAREALDRANRDNDGLRAALRAMVMQESDRTVPGVVMTFHPVYTAPQDVEVLYYFGALGPVYVTGTREGEDGVSTRINGWHPLKSFDGWMPMPECKLATREESAARGGRR